MKTRLSHLILQLRLHHRGLCSVRRTVQYLSKLSHLFSKMLSRQIYSLRLQRLLRVLRVLRRSVMRSQRHSLPLGLCLGNLSPQARIHLWKLRTSLAPLMMRLLSQSMASLLLAPVTCLDKSLQIKKSQQVLFSGIWLQILTLLPRDYLEMPDRKSQNLKTLKLRASHNRKSIHYWLKRSRNQIRF